MTSSASGTPTPSPGLPPEAIEGYRIVRVLGEGGMATVYAAQQAHPKRTVAIKVLRPSVASPPMLRRFRKEIDVLARLSHPAIAQIYAAGVVRDGASALPYFVMEYIPSAQTILEFATSHALDRRTRIKLFAQVCAAVEHGHRQRVLHLDLKPGNVLVTREGHVKVIDFGVARVLEAPAPDVTSTTADHAILGSLHAMSPEQIDPAGRDLDARSDVYSLGVLLYRLLLGRLPYELSSTSVVRAARMICESPPRPPSEVDATITPALEAVMLRALAKEPAERFRNAGELGKALLRAGGSDAESPPRKDVAAPAETERDAGRAPGKWVAIVTGVFVTAALVVSLMMLQREGGSNAVSRRSPGDATPAPTGRPEYQFGQRVATSFYLSAHTGLITGLCMDAAGEVLASSSHDRSVRVWDLRDQSLTRALMNHDDALLECVALHPAGMLVASGSRTGSVAIERVSDGRLQEKLALIVGPVHFLAFGPEGELAAAGGDLTVRLWDGDGQAWRTLRSSSGALTCGTFSDDGKFLAAGSTGGHVYVWALETGGQEGRYHVGSDGLRAIALSRDNTQLTLLTEAGVAVRLERASGERMARFALPGDAPTAVTLDAEGEHVIAARANRTVEVWRIEDGVQVGESVHIAHLATRLAYSDASSWLAIGSAEGTIEVHAIPLADAP